MNTQQADELLSAYLDGELSAEEQSQIERWLAEDPARRKKLAQLQVLRGALQALPREELPAEFPSRVLKIIERNSLLSESAATTGDAIRSENGSKLAASHRWLRYGVRVLAPLATAALGLMFIFASNFFVEQAPTAPQSDAGPSRRNLEPRARERLKSQELAEHDAAPPGPAESLRFPSPEGVQRAEKFSLSRQENAGMPRGSEPAPSQSLEPGAPFPADPGGGGNQAPSIAASRPADDASHAPTEALREALAEQQANPDAVAVVRLYLERMTDAGNKALTPQEGEQLIIKDLRADRFEAVTASAQKSLVQSLNAPDGAPLPAVPGLEDPLLLIVGDLDAVEKWWDKIRTRDETESQIRVVAQVELQNFAKEVDGLTAEIVEATSQFLGRQTTGGNPDAAVAKSEEGRDLPVNEVVLEDSVGDGPAGVLAQLTLRSAGLPPTDESLRELTEAQAAGKSSERLAQRQESANKKQKRAQQDDGASPPPAGDKLVVGRAAPARRAGSARASRQTARVVIQFMARPPGPADAPPAEPASSAVVEPANGDRPAAVPTPSASPEIRPQ